MNSRLSVLLLLFLIYSCQKEKKQQCIVNDKQPTHNVPQISNQEVFITSYNAYGAYGVMNLEKFNPCKADYQKLRDLQNL